LQKILNGVKNIAYFIMTMSLLVMAACSSQPVVTESTGEVTDVEQGRGFSALVCEGTNDTLLVFLRTPYDGHDPDTLNVLQANKNHRVYGLPNVGDNVMVLPCIEDSTQVEVVIVVEDLIGRWGYEAHPTLRQRAGMSTDTISLPDTIKALLRVAREYSIDLKNDHTMLAFGVGRSHMYDESPVEYPRMKRYSAWRIVDDCLLMSVSATDSTGQRVVTGVDTAHFVMLTPDTLVLNINGTIQGYGKK
jgi:hypothetical protein